MKWNMVTTIRDTTYWSATRNYRRIYTTTNSYAEPGDDATIFTCLKDVQDSVKQAEREAPMSPEQAAEKLEEIIVSNDCESGHLYADDLLLDILESLGYDLKVIFKNGIFYYS